MIRRFLLRHSDKFISQWLILLLDLLIVLVTAPVAFWIVYNLRADQLVVTKIVQYSLGAVVAYLIGSLISKSYRGVIRHTSLEDALNVVLGAFIGLVVLIVLNILIDKTKVFFDIRLPFALLFLHNFFSTFVLILFRLVTKLTYYRLLKPRVIGNNTVIYGAGELGILTKNVLLNDSKMNARIVAYLEDNPNKIKKRIQGIEVYDSRGFNSEMIQSQKVSTLVLAIERLDADRRTQIVETCLENQVVIRQAPPMDAWINGQISSQQIRQVKIEDLLQRAPLELNKTHIKKYFGDKTALVSGAAGSIGGEIVKQLVINEVKKVVILDHAETPVFDLRQALAAIGTTFCEVCDEIISVTDQVGLKEVFEKHHPDVVFHAAALKHVPLMERHPKAAFNTNVIGTRLVAELAGQFQVEKFVLVSTDKAVRPTNVMGASKRLAEMYIKALHDANKYSTKYIVTRFGNVLGSNGSVIPTFRKQIENGGPIRVTHPEITRYFMTIPEACQLVLEAGVMGGGGETYIFDMGEPVKIVDLAKKMIALSGMRLDTDISIEFSGLRPGEKLYEELWHGDEKQLGTYHDKIMIAETSTASLSEIDDVVDRLSDFCQTQSNEKLSESLLDFSNQIIPAELRET